MKYEVTERAEILLKEEVKIVRISVRDLVEFVLREGDIDNRKIGMSDKDVMAMGGRLHRKIQRQMGIGLSCGNSDEASDSMWRIRS